MKNVIKEIIPGSIAEEVQIEVGDILLKINDTEIIDIIDYRFLSADEELLLEIQKKNGEVWEIEIEKDYGEELGIEFDGGLLDKAKSCSNKCIFCFIDQLPKGMRDTLYFKDDDSRLSFLQGNFVTLTNMKDEDIDRIIRYRISPINVSVHTTNPELREKMLTNRFAGNILDRMKKLKEAGIQMNAQIVCIPEVNDKEELKRTVLDLYSLYPEVNNVAVVPIGITKYREGLYKVNKFTKESSKETIALIEEMQKKFYSEVNEPFVRLSDEFYLVAEQEIPSEEYYNGYQQIEDGVGVTRCFRNNIERTLENLDKDSKGSYSIVTAKLSYDEVLNAKNKICKTNPNIHIDVFKIINNFFGNTITVTGLLTGKDIIKQLSGRINTKYLFMADNMFRRGYELAPEQAIMLDDITIADIERELNIKVITCDFSGEDLIELINKYNEEEI
jgi:putative radical SAM enzyme (TIGR03279 family)